MSKATNATEITRGNLASVELDIPASAIQFSKLSGRIGVHEGKRVLILSGNALLDLSVKEDNLDAALIHLEEDGTLGIGLEAGQEALGFVEVKAQVDAAVKQFESLNPMGPAKTLKFAALGDVAGAFAAYPDADNLAEVNEAILNERLADMDPFLRMLMQLGA